MTAPRLAPNQSVAGKYTIKSHLREDGAIASYFAVDGQGRDLAIKLYTPQLAQRADVMGEIQGVFAKINALPAGGVVHILDAGIDPGSSAPFSVTEKLGSPSLEAVVGQGKLAPAACAEMLKSIARTLDAAHQQGLFHHALKPTNLFVTSQSPWAVRVADFGANLARGVLPTQSAYAFAAPWMAPEQLQGDNSSRAAADVFALALIAFYAMTGASYWRASSASGLDVGSFQREVAGERAQPSVRGAQSGGAVPASLDAVLLKALSVAPGDRHASAGLFATAFADAAAGKGAAASAAPAARGNDRFKSTQYQPEPAAPPSRGNDRFKSTQYAAESAPSAPSPPRPAAGASAAPPARPMPASFPASPPIPPPPQNFDGEETRAAIELPPGFEPAPAAKVVIEPPPPPPMMEEPAPFPPAAPAVEQPPPPPPKSSKGLVIGLLLAGVVVGGGVGAFVLLRSSSSTDKTASKDSKSSDDDDDDDSKSSDDTKGEDTKKPKKKKPKGDDTTTATTTAATTSDTTAASTEPSTSTSASTADSASAAPPASSTAPPDDTLVPLTVTCTPACDTLYVDGKKVDASAPAKVKPGNHTIVASKGGYKAVQEQVAVGNDPVEKTYTLSVAPAAPPPTTKPTCGKFLKKCQ